MIPAQISYFILGNKVASGQKSPMIVVFKITAQRVKHRDPSLLPVIILACQVVLSTLERRQRRRYREE